MIAFTTFSFVKLIASDSSSYKSSLYSGYFSPIYSITAGCLLTTIGVSVEIHSILQ